MYMYTYEKVRNSLNGRFKVALIFLLSNLQSFPLLEENIKKVGPLLT